MKKSSSIFFVLLLFIIVACNGGRSDKNQKKSQSFETSADIVNLKQSLDNIYFLFPSPAEVLFTINEGGLVYNPKLINLTERKEMYVKSNEKYLNLGIYMADLCYCALFKRVAEVENYLETIIKLSDELRLSNSVKKDLIEKIKEDVNSIDSINKITNDFYFNVINDLEANERQKDVILITTGAYIECLYLTINQVNKYSKNNLIIQKIIEQKNAFNILYMYSKKHSPKEELTQLNSLLQEINDAFSQLSPDDEEIEIVKDSINHIMVNGGNAVVAEEKEFIKFKERVCEIRQTITKQPIK